MHFLGKDWVHLKGPRGQGQCKMLPITKMCPDQKLSLEKPGLVEGKDTWKPTLRTDRNLLLSGHHAYTCSEKTYVFV